MDSSLPWITTFDSLYGQTQDVDLIINTDPETRTNLQTLNLQRSNLHARLASVILQN